LRAKFIAKAWQPDAPEGLGSTQSILHGVPYNSSATGIADGEWPAFFVRERQRIVAGI
jgi:hypothetical protein